MGKGTQTRSLRGTAPSASRRIRSNASSGSHTTGNGSGSSSSNRQGSSSRHSSSSSFGTSIGYGGSSDGLESVELVGYGLRISPMETMPAVEEESMRSHPIDVPLPSNFIPPVPISSLSESYATLTIDSSERVSSDADGVQVHSLDVSLSDVDNLSRESAKETRIPFVRFLPVTSNTTFMSPEDSTHISTNDTISHGYRMHSALNPDSLTQRSLHVDSIGEDIANFDEGEEFDGFLPEDESSENESGDETEEEESEPEEDALLLSSRTLPEEDEQEYMEEINRIEKDLSLFFASRYPSNPELSNLAEYYSLQPSSDEDREFSETYERANDMRPSAPSSSNSIRVHVPSVKEKPASKKGKKKTNSKDSKKEKKPVKKLFSIPAMIDYFPGLPPLVISAPHAGDQDVIGCSVRKGIYSNAVKVRAIKGVDGGTRVMSRIIARTIESIVGQPVHLIRSVFHRRYADLNRGPLRNDGSPWNPKTGSGYETDEQKSQWHGYHDLLRRVLSMHVKAHGHCLLIDLHSNNRSSCGHAQIPIKECITRGTCNGKSVQGLLRQFGEGALVGPDSIFGQLHSRGYTIEPTISSSLADECVYQGGYITRHYGSLVGVDAIQIEIGSAYRSTPERIKKTAIDIGEVIAHFFQTHFVKYVPVY